ncbi:MAG: T9SS type A sorting domain-containing protein [Elusimicrobia bacterium]|nr:T9SS type A sorting domain-containing protein [Elusimicrobiota bacterium]
MTGGLTNNGTISANGANGTTDLSGSYGGGGGSGGGINIAAGSLAGSGLVSAVGGSGGAGSTANGGGGGAGRAFVRAIGASTFDGTVTVVGGAAGGTGAQAGFQGTNYQPGLITPAGGTVTSALTAALKVVFLPNSYSFNVIAKAESKLELSSSDLDLSSAAISNSTHTLVRNSTAKFTTVVATNTSVSPGRSAQLVMISLPVSTDTAGNVTVSAAGFRAQSLLVPLSVMRVYRLNGVTNVFEMVLDGVNLPNLGNGTVDAEIGDPNGIFVAGAAPGGQVSTGTATIELVAGSSGTATIQLVSGSSVSVDVPLGAFADSTSLLLTIPADSTLPIFPTGLNWATTGLTISINTSDGQQPLVSIPVTMSYTAADVAGLKPNNLRMARYDAAAGWKVLASTVDTVRRRVTAFTDHFSLFTLVAVSPGDLSQGFAYPNPFRPSKGHTNIKFANLPASARIRIYTARGRLLKELDADTVGQVLAWNGTDNDGRSLPSGVYLAVFESEGKKRTVTFTVQR